jgi:putative transposase
MKQQRSSSHSVHQLQVHLVWVTKYRYHVLQGEVQLRCRELIRQTCNALDIQILKGVVSKDHIHLHVSYSPSLSVSDIAKRLKGRSAKLLLAEYPELKRRYWGGHLWGIGYGAWSVGSITDELLQAYLDHHKQDPNGDENFILE